jgi:hypothetical protein
MLKKLFPPATELTLFVTATSLVSLFFYMDGWGHTATEIIAGHFSDALKEVDKSNNIVSGFLSFLGGVILFPAIILSCMIAPIIMPFTRWDLRAWAVWILLLDCTIISIYNIVIAFQTPTKFQLAITAYCVIWSVYVYLCMESNKIDYLIDKQKSNPRYTFAAGIVSMIAIFIAIDFFAVHWVQAYSISIVIVSVLFSFTSPSNSAARIQN